MQVKPAEDTEKESSFLFLASIRRLMLYLGLLVAYSQLTSIGLTGLYRYSPSELAFVDGGSPAVFDAVALFQPPDRIGTVTDLRAKGLMVHYTTIEYAVWTIIAPILGSATFFLAYAAKARSATAKPLLVVGSAVGIFAAGIIKLHEFQSGSLGWAVISMTATGGPLAQPVHPLYGYVELLGSLVLPVVAYSAVILSVLVMTWRRLVGKTTGTAQI